MTNTTIQPVEATVPIAPLKPSHEMVAMDAAEVPQVRTKLRLMAILAALYLALFIAALDQTIIATIVPTITSQLHSASGYFWIGAAYLLAESAAGPIWAKCSDIWGRKPALLGAVVLFAVASILAALSSSMPMLIAARALQGTAGGGLVQLVLITVSDLFSMRRRSLYLGLVEVVWALAGGAGPLIGGALAQLVNWRWCFWINLPVCGAAFVLLALFLDVHNPKTRLREGIMAIDWLGTLSILAVTLMLLLGLNFGGSVFPWSSPKVICLIVFGSVAIGFFLFSEKRLAKYPLMPLGMFADPSNMGAFAIGFLHSMVLIATKYYLPLYFQSSLQASPLRSGVLLLPNTIPEAAVGILAGVLIHQTGRYRELIWVGVSLLTLGTGLFIHFSPSTSVAEIVIFQVIGGLGSGALFEAPLIAIQNTVRQSECASATAAFGFLRSVAAAVSVVAGGVIFQNSMNSQIAHLKAAGADQTLVDALSDGKAAANVEAIGAISDFALQRAVKEAFASSLRDMWIVFTCISAVCLIATVFVNQKDPSKEHIETRTGIDEMKQRS